MTFFLAAVIAALCVAVIAQAITIAHLAERRPTRRPREQRPGPRTDPHRVDPSAPYRTPRPARSLLADVTEERPRGGRDG